MGWRRWSTRWQQLFHIRLNRRVCTKNVGSSGCRARARCPSSNQRRSSKRTVAYNHEKTASIYPNSALNLREDAALGAIPVSLWGPRI